MRLPNVEPSLCRGFDVQSMVRSPSGALYPRPRKLTLAGADKDGETAAPENLADASLPVNETAGVLPRQAKPPNRPTKEQVFKGVTNYVNERMATLLRMQMFAEDDRPYLEDERMVAIELLKLPCGEEGSVYEHLTSEWRLRLPPKSAVENWALDIQ